MTARSGPIPQRPRCPCWPTSFWPAVENQLDGSGFAITPPLAVIANRWTTRLGERRFLKQQSRPPHSAGSAG